MNVDELIELGNRGDHEALTAYWNAEAEKIISAANPKSILKLRALKAQIDRENSRIKNQQVRSEHAYQQMMASFLTLNEMLQGISGGR